MAAGTQGSWVSSENLSPISTINLLSLFEIVKLLDCRQMLWCIFIVLYLVIVTTPIVTRVRYECQGDEMQLMPRGSGFILLINQKALSSISGNKINSLF